MFCKVCYLQYIPDLFCLDGMFIGEIEILKSPIISVGVSNMFFKL